MVETKPIFSAGARYERAAMRSHLERLAKQNGDSHGAIIEQILEWVRTRQSRYDKKPGGL